MTLQQLEYIVAVDRFRHFVSAAEACDVTQPTMSLMIKKLEEELDVKIFDRQKHPLEPTIIGREIIDRAKLVLYNANQIRELVDNEKGSLGGGLKIALISTVAPVLMPGIFTWFIRQHPEMKVEAEEMITSTIIYKLRKAEIDMGVIASPSGCEDLLEIPLYREEFFAYVSPEEKGIGLETIDSDDLVKHDLWVISDGVRLYDRDRMKGQTYERLYEGGRVGILIKLVNDNGGITIIPQTHVDLLLYSQHKNLRKIVSPVPSRVISLVIRKDFIHERLLNEVIAAIKHIIPPNMLEDIIRQDYISL